MSSLYRLKAYFGMVPPEDMQAYADAYGYDDSDYAPGDHPTRRLAGSRRDARQSVEPSDGPDDHTGPWAPPGYAEREPDAHRGREAGATRPRHDPWSAPDPAAARATSGSSRSGHRLPSVHGSLAVDAVSAAVRERSGVLEPFAPLCGSSGAALASVLPTSRITTVHPRSYNEARTIGERYRDGIPVIINLTELDDAAAKRLVDFAAGLAFALRGSIDKVTSRVFLLSPSGVEVSAEERRRLAERGLAGQE